VGLELRDIQALPPRDLLLVFESPEDTQGPAVSRLRLSADPDNSRLHLQQGRLQRGKGPTGPFFRRLEEELLGARLKALAQVRGDRLVLLEFTGCPAGSRSLLAELTGRHANLVLLDREDKVLDLLVPAPRKQSAPRVEVGRLWAPPPGAPPRGDTPPSVVEAFDEPPDPPPGVLAGHPPLAPLSWRIEGVLGRAADEREQAAARKRLRKRIERKRSRATSLSTGLRRKLEATEGAERIRLDGELLTANLGRLTRGQAFVEVEDWYSEGSPTRRIELDPRRGPGENVERLFERYKKLERARAEIPTELERAERRLTAIDELLVLCDDPERDPDEVEAQGLADGLLDPAQEADPRKRKAPAPRLPYNVFHSKKGTEIRVGRSARDNDALTFKHARGNDLWLHTADAPGSHVVLRSGDRRPPKGRRSKAAAPPRGDEPDQEDLLDAAHLAVHFSPLRGATRASVHVALRKLVHKPRGAKPGLVTLSGGRKLDLRLQPERLARLVRPER
jgi:predicted ribosome quality control (RQC) complex YloA/Tae2 family protein